MTRCDGKESVYISRPLSPSLVVLILSRVIQTRVFTKQKFIYICVNVCVCVCVSFLDARAQQQGKDEEKRAKNENLKKEGLLLFSSFFVSLSLEYFFPPKIFLLLSEKFFSRRTNKNTSKNDTANNASFRSRLHVLFYIL
jgi:hypothetical protein